MSEKNPHIGSSVESFFEEEGMLAEVEALSRAALPSRAVGLHHAAMAVWGERSKAMREDLDFGPPAPPPTLMMESRAVGLLVASVASAGNGAAADFILRAWAPEPVINFQDEGELRDLSPGPAFTPEEKAEHQRRVKEVVEGRVQAKSLEDIVRAAVDLDRPDFHQPTVDKLMADMNDRWAARPDGGPEVFGNPPNLRAAEELRQLMSDISENCYCASWLMGLEYTLWSFATDPSTRRGTDWGQDSVSEGEIGELRRLSAECDGWIVFDTEAPITKTCLGETWVPLDKWLIMWRRVVQRIGDDGQPVPEGTSLCPWCGVNLVTEPRVDAHGNKHYWHGCKSCGRSAV